MRSQFPVTALALAIVLAATPSFAQETDAPRAETDTIRGIGPTVGERAHVIIVTATRLDELLRWNWARRSSAIAA